MMDEDHAKYGEAKDLLMKQKAINEAHQAMEDYRDEHSPDIALLLTLARVVRVIILGDLGPGAAQHIKAIDDALKPFEAYPVLDEYEDS